MTTSGSDVVVVIARVRHSQKLSDTPVKPWIAALQNGTVLCAHCTCMADLAKHDPMSQLFFLPWRPTRGIEIVYLAPLNCVRGCHLLSYNTRFHHPGNKTAAHE